jgi:hypothetical protein
MNIPRDRIREYERRFCTYSYYITGDSKLLIKWILSTDFNEHINLANKYKSMKHDTLNDILTKYNINDTKYYRETIEQFITAKFNIGQHYGLATKQKKIDELEKEYGLMVFYNYEFSDNYFKCMECYLRSKCAYWDYYCIKYRKLIKQCKWAPFLLHFAGNNKKSLHFKSLNEPFNLTELIIYDIHIYLTIKDTLKKYILVLEELQYSPPFVQHLAEKW